MKTRAEFLKEADKRIGKDGSELFERYKCTTDWCMMQVYYLIHDKCEIDIPKTYSCSTFCNSGFAKLRKNHDYKTAEVADILFFENNGSKADGPDHVGVVIENTGSTIKVLEGNTNGNESNWCMTSTSNVFEYPYDYSGFDCIIDMSEFFDDEVEEVNEVEEKQPVDETEDTFTFSMRVLKKGCKGKDVKRIQHLLIQDGYSCGHWCDDGDFGDATEKAVIAWQKAHRLTADGIFGKETMTEFMKR